MEPVRLGVIGCGVIGDVHLTMAKRSKLIDVVAIADIRAEALRQAADAHGVNTTYDSGMALLDDLNVEAVVLALPAAVRQKLALRAFKKGKHVLTEKPVAMNAQEVKRMIAARGDLVAGCCSSRHRFQPSAKVAAEFLVTGALGELRVLHSRGIISNRPAPAEPPPEWRLKTSLNGGGTMANWGCYDLDYLLGLTGWSLKPQLVLGQKWRIATQLERTVPSGSDAETHFAALVRCEGGPVISIERAEYCSAERSDLWQIIGACGSLRLHMTPTKGKKIVHTETSLTEGLVTRTLWEGDEGFDTANAGPVLDFAAAIRERRQPATTLENALVVQQITDAVYASAEKGEAIKIN